MITKFELADGKTLLLLKMARSRTNEVRLLEKDTLLAYMLVSPISATTDNIDYIEVDPMLRGQGLASYLMDAYTKHTKKFLFAKTFTLAGLCSIAHRFLTKKEIKKRVLHGDFTD